MDLSGFKEHCDTQSKTSSAMRITTRLKLTHMRLRLLAKRCEADGTVSRQLIVPSPHPTDHSRRTCTFQCMDTVRVVCEPAYWILCFTQWYSAQAISVHGLTVCGPTHCLRIFLHKQSCRDTLGIMAKGPRGVTGTGLHPGNLTRRTAIKGGASGAHAATLLSTMAGPIIGRKAIRVTRPRTGRGQLRLKMDPRWRSWRAETGTRVRRHGNAAGTAQASKASDVEVVSATEKDTVWSRLGELHRLLNKRKGSLSATCKKER